MASNTIKGLTVEIGGDTTKLGKALDSVEKQGKSLSTELGQINRLLKLDPSNVELLAQKQQVLANAISNTEDKLNTLREAEKQVQVQFEKGDVTEEQYRALQREIIATESKLTKYKQAAEETAEAVESLGKDSDQAADKIDDAGAAAGDAAKSVDNLADKSEKAAKSSKEASEAVDDLGEKAADTAKNGVKVLAASAAGAVASVVALAESTREYRSEMGKLDTAYTTSGHSAQTAKEAYKSLQGVIGETDQSVEAAQQIALLAESSKDVTTWAGLAAGVVGRFGDALQPETFYEASNETIKLGEATGAYTQMLEGTGYSVDKFNEGLQACKTYQGKQAYMLKITESLLGDAADSYRDTNKEVIEANEATDDWNSTLAGIGKNVEPVVTGFKELGISILEDAEEPLEDAANFIRTKFLPALKDTGTWVKQNIPQISGVVAGLTATTVLYKATVLSSELATKGLTVATVAQQTAQKALNVVMNANPYVLLATAVIGATTALAALNLATKDTVEPLQVLTEEQQKVTESAIKAAEAFDEQQQATQEAMATSVDEMAHVQELADELMGLADASGKVAEKDQERANFLLTKMNEALGTEYQMVDGVIQQYGDLKTSIDEVIQSKLANSLLEAANADYVAAVQAEADALDRVRNAEQELLAQKEYYTQREDEIAQERIEIQAKLDAAREAGNTREEQIYTVQLSRLDGLLAAEQQNLADKQAAYDEAAVQYGEYHNTILNYQDAEEAALAGNYEQVKQLLLKKGEAHGNYSEKVDEETAQVLDTLYQEAVQAGAEAARMKKNFEDGVEGYTEEMVKEAEEGYEAALDAYANAYADAESVGEDLGDGLKNGMENKRTSLYTKAKNLVTGVISAMRAAADSHSPARKTIAFGEDMGEGTVIGMDRKVPDLKKAATRQTAAILDTFSSQEVAGQTALRRVADQQAARTTTAQMSAASATTPVLDKILAAIERGQVILLDGKQLIGSTAASYDSTLGQRRALVKRGAL